MKVKALTVGPILGSVTGNNARVFGRGEYHQYTRALLQWWNSRLGKKRHFFGVTRIRLLGEFNFQTPRIFRINPNFDMTGIAIFNNLLPEKDYEYQIGWVECYRKNLDNLEKEIFDWSNIPIYQFKTAAIDTYQSRSFVFGSCRYLLRLFGSSFFDDRGDKTFRSILRQIDAGIATDALIMVGDQIYADDLNFIAADQNIDQFFKRYQESFSQPYIRKLYPLSKSG